MKIKIIPGELNESFFPDEKEYILRVVKNLPADELKKISSFLATLKDKSG